MTGIEFILNVAQCAQNAYRDLGKVKPSVCIAMAIVESNWGKAGSCKYNSYMGQKRGTGKTATKYWGGKSFSSKTNECYDQSSGKLTQITDSFRIYDSMEQCVYNYYELLNTSLYKKVTDCDPYDQIQQIKDCGYFTSTTEVKTCRDLMEQYDLYQYDTNTVQTPSTDVGKRSVPRFSGVVSAMDWMDMDSSFSHREELAKAFGIKDYKGTAEQNKKLMHEIAMHALYGALAILEEE